MFTVKTDSINFVFILVFQGCDLLKIYTIVVVLIVACKLVVAGSIPVLVRYLYFVQIFFSGLGFSFLILHAEGTLSRLDILLSRCFRKHYST